MSFHSCAQLGWRTEKKAGGGEGEADEYSGKVSVLE